VSKKLIRTASSPLYPVVSDRRITSGPSRLLGVFQKQAESVEVVTKGYVFDEVLSPPGLVSLYFYWLDIFDGVLAEERGQERE
jgi:hypothetical protein